VLAGPFAAYQLALLGADVIKVEDPGDPDQSRVSGGDPALSRNGMGTYFLTQGSNKRSITLNLKTEAGQAIFKKLVATADILVENYRPGAFEALGLDYDELSAINPKLIYCSISAFGHGGPRGEETAYARCEQSPAAAAAVESSRPSRDGEGRQRSAPQRPRPRDGAADRAPARPHRRRMGALPRGQRDVMLGAINDALPKSIDSPFGCFLGARNRTYNR
jgi:crotonobetainyl-CoA:carnitine CoA-transferase CaiB-like acyl-CoA transferase